MGIWNKSPKRDPREIAQIQAQIDADPVVQKYRAGVQAPDSPWVMEQGRVKDPNQLAKYIKSKYGVPDGYDVSQQGQVVYTNKTPILQQLTLASLPVTGLTGLDLLTGPGLGLGAASGAGAGSGSAAATGGTLTNAAGPTGAYSWMYAPSAAPSVAAPSLGAATGTGAGLLSAGNDAINQAIDNGMAGSEGAPLGGVRPPSAGAGGDLANRFRDWFTDPRNIIGLAGMAGSLATRPNGGMSADQQAAQAQANRMAAITEARMRRVDPLHQAVTQLAFGRLPVSSRNGIALNNVPLPE